MLSLDCWGWNLTYEKALTTTMAVSNSMPQEIAAWEWSAPPSSHVRVECCIPTKTVNEFVQIPVASGGLQDPRARRVSAGSERGAAARDTGVCQRNTPPETKER